MFRARIARAAVTLLGLGLVLAALAHLSPLAWTAMGESAAMIAALALACEIPPLVKSGRPVGSPVSMSLAFVFAAMYVWGPALALVLFAGTTVLSGLLRKEGLGSVTSSMAEGSVSVAASWLVLAAGDSQASPDAPDLLLSARDLPWIFGSWVALYLCNTALASLTGRHAHRGWSGVRGNEFWYGTGATAAVLALSPLVAVVATAHPDSWSVLPLLLVPLLAVQRSSEITQEREFQALHDWLTGLPNRQLFAQRVDAALERPGARQGGTAVILLDLDHFKLVNDALGHATGDALLCGVADRLRSLARTDETLARLSGDEFAMLAIRESAADIDELAQTVRQSMRRPFPSYEGRSLSISASIGLALADPDSTALSLTRQADSAMSRAKLAGRDRVLQFDQVRHTLSPALLDDHLGLRTALARDELRAHYQPIVDLATDEVVGVEALVRWERPGHGLLGAQEVIPLAEETGLIDAVGTWMIDHTLRQLRDWRREEPMTRGLWAAVNVSALQIGDPMLVNVISELLARYRVPASDLHLEITESSVMQASDAAAALAALRTLGVHLILDDFGTGHSSLARLKGLPVSTVKIDQSFIAGLATSAPDRSIVDAVVTMSRSMQLDVIAEGVQSEKQREDLIRLGVRFGQGYLWVPPQAAPDLAHWLHARQEAPWQARDEAR